MEYNGKYCVYTHKVVTDDNGPMWYVGMTNSTKSRWYKSNYKSTSLYPFIERYGWENIEHRVIAEGMDRETALKLEDFLICMYRNADCGINDKRSGMIESGDLDKYQQNYRNAHREQQREYRNEHKEERRLYDSKNRDKINAQQRKRYAERMKAKHAKTCPC